MQITSMEGSKKSARIWRAQGCLENETRPGILGETSEPTRILFSIHSEGLKSEVIAFGANNEAILGMTFNLLLRTAF